MPKGIEPLYDHWASLSQQEWNSLMFEFEKFCEDGSMIINKNGQAVPFKLNEAQRAVADFLMAEIFKEIPAPINLFIHKCRQMGISVVIAKIEQFVSSRKRNLNCQHLMPTEPDADDLCEKKFIPQLQGTHPELLPKVHQVKRKVKFLEWPQQPPIKLNSSVTFSSAEQHAPGHGQTNQIVIEDEQAHYKRVTRLERGMLATMPKTGLAVRVVVSTALGLNHFSDLSKVAKKSPHWKYLFLPWHMLSEYEMEPQGRLQKLESLTDYEVKLCDIFEEKGYPVETWARKMQWWEHTFQTEAKMDWDHMFENYPSTAEESFAATGTPVLPAHKLVELQKNLKPFKYIELTQDVSGTARFIETNLSTIKQFASPIKGRRYLCAVDPSDGGADGDPSSVTIIDLITMEDVCCIKEKIDQNELAELLNHLGRYYNNAEIVVERNKGQTLIDWLVMLRYPRIYIDPLHTTKARVVYGVYMTRPVKNDAITRAKFLLNFNIYKSYDPDFLEEGLHFAWTKTPSGLRKAEGTEGYGDDCVMSRLIGIATLNMSKWKEFKTYVKTEHQQRYAEE